MYYLNKLNARVFIIFLSEFSTTMFLQLIPNIQLKSLFILRDSVTNLVKHSLISVFLLKFLYYLVLKASSTYTHWRLLFSYESA